MAAVVRAGQASLNFWLLSCTFVFQSTAFPGLTFFKSPNIAKPCSLPASVVGHSIPKVTLKKSLLIIGLLGLTILLGLYAKRKFYKLNYRLENSKMETEPFSRKGGLKNGDIIFQVDKLR